MKTAKNMTVVSAAAGTGKTTRLVREYLSLLKGGIAPGQIIAITFTRKAAAELVEKVSICLRHILDEPIPAGFETEFEECFSQYVPEDKGFVRNALFELPNAPAGTIDSFVQRLLAEFALEARLPTGSANGGVWLDLPIGQGKVQELVEAAVRAEIDPDNGAVPEEASELLKNMGLQELLRNVSNVILTVSAEEISKDSNFAGSQKLVNLALKKCPKAFSAMRVEIPDIFTGIKAAGVLKWVEPVQKWAEAGMNEPVPIEAMSWYAAVMATTSTRKDDLCKIFQRPEYLIDLGVVKMNLDTLMRINPKSLKPEDLDECDRIRRFTVALARRARARAYTMAAQASALDHDLLTEVAIDLCTRDGISERLRHRFKALLVDEVQDSSPRQFRLYDALLHLPGSEDSLKSFFVGDSRQSIYLFRGAEPAGLTDLEKQARQGGGALESLGMNFRSTPKMVAAQKALFERVLTGSGDSKSLPGVSTIDHVVACEDRAAHELPQEAPYQQPIVMVTLPKKQEGKDKWSATDFNDAAIDVFCERIRHAWEAEGRTHDTAAVLTSGWGKAILARNRLRAVLRAANAGDAFLDGSRELLNGQVATDMRTIISALWDRTDEAAWAGMWRHPMIGMSDGALAAMHLGDGIVPTDKGIRGLARALNAEGLSPDVYCEKDITAFARTKPALERAAQSIGRIPTAEVIETLAACLHWRTILLAGPDGMDTLGELEVLLDWIRQAEAETVDPEAVIKLLDPKQSEEVPRVELYRGAKTVSCTTIFQAKGLKYDHVLVMSIGSSSSKNPTPALKATIEGTNRALLGVQIDPERALKPLPDPVANLSKSIGEIRKKEEALRMVYVAITRAVRSVTFAIGARNTGIHSSLSDLWTAEPEMTGVKLLTVDAPAVIDTTIRAHAKAVRGFTVEPLEPAGLVSISPSQAKDAWTTGDKDGYEALIRNVLGRIEVRDGLAPIAPPAPAGLPEDATITDGAWGTLVHSWMEHGGLTTGASIEKASNFLVREYHIDDPALAAWLVNLSGQLEKAQPELVGALRSPEVELYFELPFAGVGGTTTKDGWFHSGRMDLLAKWPDGKVWVIDFKAGQRNAEKGKDLRKGAGLDEYIPQLEAYRRALTAAGWNVEKVGLLYVRSGAWVCW